MFTGEMLIYSVCWTLMLTIASRGGLIPFLSRLFAQSSAQVFWPVGFRYLSPQWSNITSRKPLWINLSMVSQIPPHSHSFLNLWLFPLGSWTPLDTPVTGRVDNRYLKSTQFPANGRVDGKEIVHRYSRRKTPGIPQRYISICDLWSLQAFELSLLQLTNEISSINPNAPILTKIYQPSK